MRAVDSLYANGRGKLNIPFASMKYLNEKKKQNFILNVVV